MRRSTESDAAGEKCSSSNVSSRDVGAIHVQRRKNHPAQTPRSVRLSSKVVKGLAAWQFSLDPLNHENSADIKQKQHLNNERYVCYETGIRKTDRARTTPFLFAQLSAEKKYLSVPAKTSASARNRNGPARPSAAGRSRPPGSSRGGRARAERGDMNRCRRQRCGQNASFERIRQSTRCQQKEQLMLWPLLSTVNRE